MHKISEKDTIKMCTENCEKTKFLRQVFVTIKKYFYY